MEEQCHHEVGLWLPNHYSHIYYTLLIPMPYPTQLYTHIHIIIYYVNISHTHIWMHITTTSMNGKKTLTTCGRNHIFGWINK